VAISWPISINLIVACRTNFTTFGQFIVVAKRFFLKFPAVFGLWQIDWKIFMVWGKSFNERYETNMYCFIKQISLPKEGMTKVLITFE